MGRHDYVPSGDDGTDRTRLTVEGLLNDERAAREQREFVAPQDTPLIANSAAPTVDRTSDGEAAEAARPVSSAQRLAELREAAARSAREREDAAYDEVSWPAATTDHAAPDRRMHEQPIESPANELCWEATDLAEPFPPVEDDESSGTRGFAAPTARVDFDAPTSAPGSIPPTAPVEITGPTAPVEFDLPTATSEPIAEPVSFTEPVAAERSVATDQSAPTAWSELDASRPEIAELDVAESEAPSDATPEVPVESEATVSEPDLAEPGGFDSVADAEPTAENGVDGAVTDDRTAALLAAEQRDRDIIERARRDRERFSQQRDEEDIWTADQAAGPTGKKRRKIVPFLALLVAIGVLVAAGLFVKDLFFSQTPAADFTGSGKETVQVRVDQGDTISDIAAKLESAGVVASARAFTEAAANNPNSTSLQPGLYSLKTEMKASLALDAMLNPSAIQTITVTIPEGLTVVQTLQRLADATGRPLEEFQAAANDWASLGAPTWFPPTATNIEGLLQPGTYDFDPEQTSAQMVQMLVANLNNVMTQAQVEQKAPALGQTPYGILTIASLIEREAKFDDERAKMARVIYNRLAANEALGIDAATAYGLGKSGLDLTTADLNDTSNPYNLRVLTGLPPTPIANVNALSIQAALNPEAGDWKWYVVNSADGHHGFFSTYDEFLAAKDVCVQNGWC